MQEPRYELLDHVCRHCLGRLLSDPWRNAVKCSRCGAEHNGPVEELCMCGVRAGQFDRLFVCARNPEQSRESPSEIVAMEAPGQTTVPKKNRPNNEPPLIFAAK